SVGATPSTGMRSKGTLVVRSAAGGATALGGAAGTGADAGGTGGDVVAPADAGAGGPITGVVAAAVSCGDVRACMRRAVHPHWPIETMPTASAATSSMPTATKTTVARVTRGGGGSPCGGGDGVGGGNVGFTARR